MRSKRVILLVLAVIVAVSVTVGIVAAAGAGQSTSLPAISAPELLAKMGQMGTATRAISGEVSWKNGLFGDLAAAGAVGELPAQLPLVSDGSGRIWLSDAGAKVESQGGAGDQIVVASAADRSLWVYDGAANTARHWVVTGTPPQDQSTSSPVPGLITPAAIAQALERLAPLARVDVAGQATVAGREAYLLRFTPTATDTALGAVQAAVDGQTFVPLRLEVFAAGGGQPVISFGFDSVSYDPVDASLFAFTPPPGATVTTKTIDGDALRARLAKAQARKTAEPTAAQKAAQEQLARRALLTREQVQGLVPYTLAWARDYTARPFRWGYVFDHGMPLTALGQPVFDLAQLGGGQDAMNATADAGTPPATGPASVLLYGNGFGAIALAQTKTTPEIDKQLKQLPALVDKTTINGAPAQLLTTPLGGAVVWQQGDTTLVAAGMVPRADLLTFAQSVR
jgi:outer membrane lipoprotein-sorting protein